ncbi:MAG: hypothetical protein ACT4PM_05305 [Gemmatimonadales bacterium]
MLGRAARGGVWFGSAAIALAYAAAFLPTRAGAVASGLMVGGITLLIVSLLALGARREGQRIPALLWIGLATVGLALGGAFAAALGLGPEGPGSPLLLGLPRRAALVLYGVGLLPAVVVPLVYALTFDRMVLTGSRLERFRAELARVRPAAGRDGEGNPDRRE